jgi:hypothetical protein
MSLNYLKLMMSAITILICSNLTAATLEWGDLDLYERYTLNQEINFENKVTLKPGDSFDMLDRIGGEIPAIYLQFHSVKCENPDLSSEMILINPNPNDTSTDRTIAVELEEGCNLGLWVEVKDYYSPSIFDEFKE